jgi:hypothetical protein
MSDSIADLTRAELERLTTRRQLVVISNSVINSTLHGGTSPHWSHNDYREMAKLVRTVAIVDVAVLGRSPMVTARAIAHYLSKAAPDTLPLFADRSDTAIARRLARHLLRVIVPRATGELAVYGREWRQRGCAPGFGPYFEFQVDEPASFIARDATRPRPSSSAAAARGSRGARPTFLAQFVVDSSGRPQRATLKFLIVPSATAADSARAVIDRWRFRPARLTGCKVSQMVQVEIER